MRKTVEFRVVARRLRDRGRRTLFPIPKGVLQRRREVRSSSPDDRATRRGAHSFPRLRRLVTTSLVALAFVLVPLGSANAAIPGCEGEPAPLPEAAGGGADGLLVPPQSAASIAQSPDGLPPDASLYGQYGTAGQQWHTIRENCVDKLGSSAVATMGNTAWDLSKTINQATITVYQAATSDGLLDSFNTMVESVIAELREGVWRPLLPTVIILGAVWLGWYGLIRKRVTLTFESAIWMVTATALGIWILVNPAQVLSLASTTVNAGSQLVNSAMGQVSVPGVAGACPGAAPEIERASWESESEFAVRENSHMLWSGLVCRPWIAGEFGSGLIADTAAEQHGVALLEAQGISRIEQQRIADGELDPVELTQEKQEAYEEIAGSIQDTYPEVYPLFSGDQAGNRLGVATLALFAAIFAGGLILAGSVALIVLKIGFLLLLLLAPVFLLIGIHPGFGRVVLLRWIEMMLGLLLKQIFIVLLIALLVMAYGMVMATNLGWGLQMILLSLFTLAMFIYRKPFAHLFASVNANTFTSRMVSDALTSSTLSRSANVLPPVAYLRAQRWGLKRMPQLGAAAAAVPAGGGPGGDPEAATGRAAGVDADTGANEPVTGRVDAGRARGQAGYGRARSGAKPPPLPFGSNAARSEGSVASRRSSAQAPRLSDVASASGGGDGGRPGGESIPPRPPGGYTGRGGNWGEIFGVGPGGGGRSTGGATSSGGGPPSDTGGSAPRPEAGGGFFRARGATPPRGNTERGSRWAAGTARPKERSPAPPRLPRGGRGGSSAGGDGDTWLSPSDRGNRDRLSSPFWAGTEAQRRRGHERDVPFWLRDEDE